jgi:hypothetical protein
MINTNDSTSKVPPADLRRLADTELSPKSRLGYVILLLVSLMMSGAIGSLWATEPLLPMRTHIAFAVMVAIGISWSAFALWTLSSRRILLAKHSVIACHMSVIFTSLYLIGALITGYAKGGGAAFVAAGVGAAMLIAAMVLLRRARRKFAELIERRNVLARQLGGNVT